MLRKILLGKDLKSKERLINFWKSIGDEEKILWYPSAYNDFRDLLELSDSRLEINRINEKPNLYIHTDHNPDINFDSFYCDKKTSIILTNKFDLELQYNRSKKIYLIDLEIKSNSIGNFVQTVLYFICDNINFLTDVILSNKIKISHLIKVRDGSGMGDLSMSILYPLLAELGVKYLFADRQYNEIDDRKLIIIISQFDLTLKDYKIKRTGTIIQNWSEKEVNIFNIITINDNLTNMRFCQIINKITGKNNELPTFSFLQ